MAELRPNTGCFGQEVTIIRSGEKGVVTGFSRHQRLRQVQYYVEYTNALGTATADWFHADEIST